MRIRLLQDPPSPPVWNMAVDEMLLERPSDIPTLRIYAWDRPAYSIGYFQSVSETVKKLRCDRTGTCVVRRPSGGGAVLHGRDLTFSFCADEASGLLPRNVRDSYLKINEVLLKGLKEIFPALDFTDCREVPRERKGADRICFEQPSCYDLMLSGKKVVGSSQRRAGGRILHQCSIFLEATMDALSAVLKEGFRAKWGAEWVERPLDAEERARAARIEETRYRLPDRSFLADSFLAKQSGQL